MGILDRLFGGKGGAAAGGDVESALETMITLYDQPDVKAESGVSITSRQATELRELGRNLHKAGGKARMEEARDALRERLPWSVKNLEAIWASLPQWKE